MATLQSLIAAEYGACAIRVSRLSSTCVPQATEDDYALSSCVVDLAATPVVQAATEIVWPGGSCDCDDCTLTVRKAEKIQRYDLTMTLKFWDYELLEILTGNTLVIGKTGGAYDGQVIGIASEGVGAGCPNGTQLEVWSRNVTTSSLCVSGSTAPYKHWILPKTTWRFGDQAFSNENPHVINLVGTAEVNPNWTDAFADWEGEDGVGANQHWASAWTDALPHETAYFGYGDGDPS